MEARAIEARAMEERATGTIVNHDGRHIFLLEAGSSEGNSIDIVRSAA